MAKILVTNKPFSITKVLVTMVFFQLPQSFFNRHIPFSIANIFYHRTMINDWTFAMDNKGFKNFLPMFFYWPIFLFFVQTFWGKKLLGNFFSEMEFQLIFQYFCYIIILEKSPYQKNEMMGCIKNVRCCLAIHQGFGVLGHPPTYFLHIDEILLLDKCI